MRPPSVALLLTVALVSCGGDDAPRADQAPALDAYAARTNTLCIAMAAAVQRAFQNAPNDPDDALFRYAGDVHDAGKRFSDAVPPPQLKRFHADAVRHLARESAALRRAAELSAAGDPAAALRSLHLTGLLPDPIPRSVLRRAPVCRGGVVPDLPEPPVGQQV